MGLVVAKKIIETAFPIQRSLILIFFALKSR